MYISGTISWSLIFIAVQTHFSAAFLSQHPLQVIVPEHRYFTEEGDFLRSVPRFLQRCQKRGLFPCTTFREKFLQRPTSCPQHQVCNCQCSCPEILYESEPNPSAFVQDDGGGSFLMGGRATEGGKKFQEPCSGSTCGVEGCDEVAPSNCYCACQRPP